MGLENASRGEGRGEVKGEAVEDLVLIKAGGATPKPGGGAGLDVTPGDEAEGVDERCSCHGAGEGRRTTVWRIGTGEEEGPFDSRNRQSASSMVSSRIVPFSEVF